MLKRRTPPLFEVLSVPDRTSMPRGSVLGRRPQPLEVRAADPRTPARPATESESGDGPAPGVRVPAAAIFLGIALLVLVGFAVWYFAFELGQQHKKQQLQPYLSDISVTTPLPPTGQATLTPNPPPAVQAPQPASPPDPAPASGDPRRSGLNYLHVVTLNWKDAERAAAYLTKNGVPAGIAQAKKTIDVETAKAKNLPLLVVVLEGIPSEQFKATEGKRRELMEKVRRIGKKWQSEEHGPSDFGEPNWAKFN